MATAANTDLTYHVDPRLPIGDSVKKSDRSHPQNVIKRLLETSNQASTDSLYDNKPQRLPPGVLKEPFVPLWTESVMTNPVQTNQILLISAILGILLCVVFVRFASNLFVKIAIVLIMVICIHYLLARLEKRTV
jgi:Flp pilus assembly protein TadB